MLPERLLGIGFEQAAKLGILLTRFYCHAAKIGHQITVKTGHNQQPLHGSFYLLDLSIFCLACLRYFRIPHTLNRLLFPRMASNTAYRARSSEYHRFYTATIGDQASSRRSSLTGSTCLFPIYILLFSFLSQLVSVCIRGRQHFKCCMSVGR